MGEECIRDPEIAFRILEINGIHLLRHGRRTNFALDDFLFQNSIADISPNVLRVTNKDRVRQFDGVKVADPVVVGQDLRGEEIRFETKTLDKFLAEGKPVHLRGGGLQGVEVADRTRELGFEFVTPQFRRGI